MVYMKVLYEAAVIENVMNALNALQVVGIHNAEIVTFIVQELKKNQILEAEETGDVDGN